MVDIIGHDIIEFAGLSGELLLRNGAETSRVEDTVKRICNKAGFEEIEVIVFPTGMILNGKYEGDRLTRARRITNRDIDLDVISQVNDISRKFADGAVSLGKGLQKVRELDSLSYKKGGFWKILLAGSGASAVATVLLGGSFADVPPAFIATFIIRFMMGINAFNLGYIIQIYVAGMLAGIMGAYFVQAGFGQHMDKIIVGALLPLVPGVALTNAVRDFISGDLLSGTLRMVEAMLVSAALAGGVGLSLALYGGRLNRMLF